MPFCVTNIFLPVLEAMLANKNDERRILLERCIASEDECEKLRDKTAETNLRLEDTQSALQELGRENQAFQVHPVLMRISSSLSLCWIFCSTFL